MIVRQKENGFYVILVFDASFRYHRFNEIMYDLLTMGEIFHLSAPNRVSRIRYCKERLLDHNIDLSDEEAGFFVDLWGHTIPKINAAIKPVVARKTFRTKEDQFNEGDNH